jgi:uncharacterized phage protein gp47/JayE
MAEFTTPSFLLNRSTNDIHAKMQKIIPADIDMSEGGHAWNMTRPTALIAAEICQFILPEVIKLIFPQWSYGEFLDHHAATRGMIRREATAAIGQVTIKGIANSVIPAGSIFSTASVNGAPTVDYETLEEVKIPASETVTVGVKCTQVGTIGNTDTGTIVMVPSRLTSVKSVTNVEALTGGTEEETDESLIERIEVYDMSQGNNFVGSVADYKRWATSIDGVGSATIIPAQDTSGLVTIILTDANGDPATEQLCTSVYNHIMRPNNPDDRLAPINAILKVTPPTTIEIGIRAVVELADDVTLESVKEAYMAQLALYLPVALDEGEIKLTRVAAALAATKGANDFSDLQIGLVTDGTVSYGMTNITIASTQLPSISVENLILTVGTV